LSTVILRISSTFVIHVLIGLLFHTKWCVRVIHRLSNGREETLTTENIAALEKSRYFVYCVASMQEDWNAKLPVHCTIPVHNT